MCSWHLGLVGFSYPEWSVSLYAQKRAGAIDGQGRQGRLLRTYSKYFNAVEINTSFYGVPSAETMRGWAEVTPEHFRFCVKMPRDVTHGPTPAGALASSSGPPLGHLLQEKTLEIARRLFDAVSELHDKLGYVLVQFPPKFAVDRQDELAGFLDRLGRGVPLAIELRNASWWTESTAAMLWARQVLMVATDELAWRKHERAGLVDWSRIAPPRPMLLTGEALYVRWLGRHDQFTDRTHEHFDPTPRLLWWKEQIDGVLKEHPEVRNVYAFFDNDFAGHAPATARRFAKLIAMSMPEWPQRTPDEPMLFG